jgi:hypothetical protein
MDGFGPWRRLYTVTTETGSVIAVIYGPTDPCPIPVTQDPATNNMAAMGDTHARLRA